MDIKTINPTNFLCFTTKTNLAGLAQYQVSKAQELLAEAQKLNLEIAGPIHWMYYDIDGKPETEFTLEVALPIASTTSSKSDFEIKTKDTFKCTSFVHKGDWSKLGDSYERELPKIAQQGHQMSHVYREVFQHIDFEAPENNITEVQVGLN